MNNVTIPEARNMLWKRLNSYDGVLSVIPGRSDNSPEFVDHLVVFVESMDYPIVAKIPKTFFGVPILIISVEKKNSMAGEKIEVDYRPRKDRIDPRDGEFSEDCHVWPPEVN